MSSYGVTKRGPKSAKRLSACLALMNLSQEGIFPENREEPSPHRSAPPILCKILVVIHLAIEIMFSVRSYGWRLRAIIPVDIKRISSARILVEGPKAVILVS